MNQNPVWGECLTDYVAKRDGICNKCRISCPDNLDKHCYYGYICAADCDIKHDYNYGRMQDAIALLRGLPSEILKDYLPEDRRTPANLKVVILDEIHKRDEMETSMRL